MTGATGAEGPTGPPGPTGPTGGSSGGGGGQATSVGVLEKGKSLVGAWSASIPFIPSGGPQAQVDGAFSFAIPLNEKTEKANVKFLTEKQVSEPGSVVGCAGSANAPVAEPGFLCVYMGATAVVGCQEAEWKNVKFFQLQDPSGSAQEGGKIGGLVVFRTGQFEEAPEPPVKVTADVQLCAAGSWAVTELK